MLSNTQFKTPITKTMASPKWRQNVLQQQHHQQITLLQCMHSFDILHHYHTNYATTSAVIISFKSSSRPQLTLPQPLSLPSSNLQTPLLFLPPCPCTTQGCAPINSVSYNVALYDDGAPASEAITPPANAPPLRNNHQKSSIFEGTQRIYSRFFLVCAFPFPHFYNFKKFHTSVLSPCP